MIIRNVVVLTLATIASSAFGQLRIVSFNTSNSATATAGPRVGMGTILSSIGSMISDDPTMPGNTGIAKPLDVLLLQESRSSALTGTGYANLLNQTYGTTSFSAGTLDGATTGTGTQVIVYNASTVQLISQAAIGTASTSGQPRQTIRNQLRPIGYGADADVYIYNGHWKAGGTSGDETRRLVEANAIRADVNANVPVGANVLYNGDFNVANSADDSIVAITAPGNGQALDPINKMDWTHGEGSKNVHTQSPWGSMVNPGNGFTGSGGGMDDRFDFQLVAQNLNDRHGTAYIPNSYQAFGNNGSHVVGAPINSGTGADANTLFYLSSIVDHLPVVADYQLPARMHVDVSSTPSRVIGGASVNVQATVMNTAPVQFSNGADTLSYSISGAGSLSGSANGTNVAALTAGNSHTLALDTSTPGVATGTINATSSSEAVASGSFSQAVSTTVLAHATPSFDAASELSVATIDFGIRGRGLGGASTSFSISNLADIGGFTAGLDLDSIARNGNTSQLSINAGTFSNLIGSGSTSFAASLSALANGTLSATYTLNFSDEDLPGAIARGPLTLVLSGIVATPGDADLNGVIDFDDYSHIDNGFNNMLAGWSNGDFDGNGMVNFDDYALIDSNFNNQGRPGMNAVPEPVGIGGISLGLVCLSRRRKMLSARARRP